MENEFVDFATKFSLSSFFSFFSLLSQKMSSSAIIQSAPLHELLLMAKNQRTKKQLLSHLFCFGVWTKRIRDGLNLSPRDQLSYYIATKCTSLGEIPLSAKKPLWSIDAKRKIRGVIIIPNSSIDENTNWKSDPTFEKQVPVFFKYLKTDNTE
jgi:hypothetical protein